MINIANADGHDYTPGYESINTPDTTNLKDLLKKSPEEIKDMPEEKLEAVSNEIMQSEYPEKAKTETPKEYKELDEEGKESIKSEATKGILGATPEISPDIQPEQLQKIEDTKREGNEEVAHIENSATTRIDNIDRRAA